VRESHGLPLSAPPQQVMSAIMADRVEGQYVASAPLKSELQRDLKKALACNKKNTFTIEHFRKANDLQKITISLCKTEAKALMKDRYKLRGKKRSLVKAFNIWMKELNDEKSALKKLLVEENRLLYKSFSGEIKKLEKRNNQNDSKIERYKRKLVLLKEDNRELAAVLHDERKKSRLTIE
jgi:hypothetical protein